MAWRYSALQNLALYAAVLPLIAAWYLVDTLDWYPYFLGAAAGLTLAYLVRGPLAGWRARLRRRAADFTAGEASGHVPGGFLRWLAPALWGVSLGLFANAYLDPSPPTLHTSEVLRYEKSGKGPGRIVLRGFRPGEEELSLSANSRAAMFLSRGDVVTVVLREGLFGWDWLEAVRPPP